MVCVYEVNGVCCMCGRCVSGVCDMHYWDITRNGFTLRLMNLNFRGLSPTKGAKEVGSRRGSLLEGVCICDVILNYFS